MYDQIHASIKFIHKEDKHSLMMLFFVVVVVVVNNCIKNFEVFFSSLFIHSFIHLFIYIFTIWIQIKEEEKKIFTINIIFICECIQYIYHILCLFLFYIYIYE